MISEKYPGFVLRHAGGMWNLLNLTHPEIPYIKPLRLNETAARVWEFLDEGKSQEEIAVLFSEEYGVSYDEVLKDISEVIEEFREFGVPV